MAKPLFQDIVPPDKKSIKRIPLPERLAREERPERPVRRVEREPAREREPRRERRGISGIVKALIAVIVIGGLAAGALYVVIPKATGATVTIIPKGQSVALENATFVATKEPSGELPFQVVTVAKEGKVTVPAAGEEQASVKATGVIRIFNNYSAAPQVLVANTRFETPKGLIFRITQGVTVPGKTGTTPGSIDVAVVADKPGADYNVGLSDFTIPGFKGDPRFEKVFGRSKSAIAGGFEGTRKKVAKTDEDVARAKIRDGLRANLVGEVAKNIPEDFVMPGNAYFIEYETLPNVSVDLGAELKEKATIHGIIFRKQDLAKAIAKKSKSAPSDKMDVLDADKLAFAPKAPSGDRLWEAETMSFALNGTTTVLVPVDIDKLKADLAGKPRNGLNAVLAAYPNVKNAEVVIRPFWKTKFPESTDSISVNVGPVALSP